MIFWKPGSSPRGSALSGQAFSQCQHVHGACREERAEAHRVGAPVYDFAKTKDLQTFQKEMQDAYNYLATEILYLIETCQQKVQRGLYGGGHLPAPYVIDRLAWKDERRPLIYCAWLEPALELFKQFHDSDFSFAYICRY